MSKIDLIQGYCEEEMKSIPDNSVDVVLADPPYGINYKSNKQRGDTRGGKEVIVRKGSYFDFIYGDNSLPIDWLPICFRKLKDGGAIYIFCHWTKWSKLESVVKRAGFKVKNMIVINKSNHGMGDLKGAYAPKHELVLFASKGRHLLQRTELGRGKDVFDGKVLFSGSHRNHPNEKPIGWIEPLIRRSCPNNGLVLDPFMGSGTAGLICKKYNYNFIGIEIDSKHFKKANDRIFEVS